MIKIVKEKFRLIFGERIKSKILNILDENRDEFIKKHPNLAVFAFDRIGTIISVYGVYEKVILSRLEDCVFNNTNSQKSVCIDVGANIGNHTLYFAQFFNKIYSFEPHPETFELLKFNVRKSKNVKVFQFGLSNNNDEMIIAHDQYASYGACSLRNKAAIRSEKETDAFNVQVKKFDDFFKDINEESNIAFVKLDVQNHELNALQGMQKALEHHSPIICFEQHPKQFDYFGKEISSKTINFLKDNEYSYFYEISYCRKWKFSNNRYLYFRFIKNILKVCEIILYGMPEMPKKLFRINKFSKKIYQAIIASKRRLE